MSTTISILSNKSEAQALVTALSNSGDPNAFEWQGEIVKLQAVSGLVVANSACHSIAAIDAILMLRNLGALTLSFNGITSLTALTCLEQLTHLDVSHNKLHDLEPLRDMKNLTMLRCNNNQITSVEPLRGAITLEELWISSNQITWESLINLQTADKLKCIVTYNNPLEKKQKVEEFLKAICGSLEMINGISIIRSGGDFMGSADGRVMLTQARGQLTPLQREDFTALTAAKRKAHPPKAMVKSGSLRSLMASQTDEDIPDTSNLRSTLSAGANEATADGGRVLSPSKSEPGGGKGSLVFKANRQRKSSGIGQRYDQGTSVLSAAGMGHLPALSSTSLDTAQSQSLADTVEMGITDINMTSTAEVLYSSDAAVTLHFGNNSSSPIAVCLYPNGTGYARWTRAGTVACSFESGGRMFSSHKSGALAAVMAPDGSGSVMDEMGNSVLTLKSSGEAIVFNAAGEIECSFGRQSINEERGEAKMKVLTIYNGATRKKIQKINLGDICAEASDNIYTLTLQWIFPDLVIEFTPARWEVVVKVFNGKAECLFSSLRGGRIEEDTASNKGTNTSPAKTKHGGQRHRHDAQPLMTDMEHDNLRSGLASLMTQMDDMIAGIKKPNR